MDHNFAVNPYGQRREILIGISVPALKVAALLRFPITTSVLSANGALKRQPSATQTTGKRNDPLRLIPKGAAMCCWLSSSSPARRTGAMQ